jgi:branched-chain amino acid transport system substrate-binding protein
MDLPKRALLLAVLLISCACARERTVRIAVAAPFTGDLGSEGQGILRAVELAVEQANAAQRFPYKLEAVPFDDRAEPDEAVNVADLIIADPSIVAVVGHYNSGCAIPAARVYAQAPIAMVAPSATAAELTLQQLKPDWPGPKVVFRVCPTDDVQGDYAADYVYGKLHKRRISIIHDKTAYGVGLAERFRMTFAALGGHILSDDGIAEGLKDFKPLLARVKQLHADGLYFAGVYTEAGLAVKQMRLMGMDKTLFLSGDGAKTPGFFDVAGDAADGAYLTTLGIPVELLPRARQFMDDYRRRWIGEDEGLRPFDHYGFEAAQIIFDALEKAGPQDRYDRAKLIKNLSRLKHDGLLGVTAFDRKGDTLNKIITMTRAEAKDRVFPAVN